VTGRTYRRVESPGGTGIDGLVVVERPVRAPGPGECVVRIEAATVNRSDIARVEGEYGGVAVARFSSYGGGAEEAAAADDGSTAYVPGMEGAGTVLAAGPDVDLGLVGRTVLIHSHSWCGACEECRAGLDNACAHGKIFGSQTPGVGAWSEQVVVPARQLFLLPEGMSPEQAVPAEVTYGPVWWGLRHLAGVGGGDVVVIEGGDSNLGVAAVQVVALLGATAVPVVRDAGSPRARELAAAGGVRVWERPDVSAESLRTEFGRRPRVVLDLLGTASFQHGLDLLAAGGVVLVLGAHTGADVPLRLDRLFRRSTAVQGVGRAPIAIMQEVLSEIAAGRLAPRIARTFRLDQVRDAVRHADDSPLLGKTLVAPAGGAGP
jgi:NADPH:quinone reductase-like Zn-dependent oxidoreductase